MAAPTSPVGMGCDGHGFTAFTAGLIMGTGSTITIKVAYDMTSLASDGVVRAFEKPLSTTFLMFLAMAMSLPLYLIYTNTSVTDTQTQAGKVTPRTRRSHWKLYMLVLIPALFDLIGTALAKVGLLYTTVSVYQLVRCTVIIVTALLKAFVYGDRLSAHMWLGVGINLLAMILVSSTTFFDKENAAPHRDPRLGVLFIVLSCIVQGTQYVFEEKVMAIDGLPPMVLIGLEGLWGVLLMVVVVFPCAYYMPGTDVGGRVENVWDSLVMVQNSKGLQIILTAFFFTVCLYNIFAIFVTHFLSSIWHAILDNFRPISVWTTDLLIFYVFTDGRFGEAWTSASWLQLSGMMMLFFGTAVYNGSVPLLLFKDYLPVSESEVLTRPSTPRRRPSLDFITPIIRTTPKMASPALMRSPFMKGRDRSGSLSQQDQGQGHQTLSSSLPRHAPYMQRPGMQPRNYGALEDGGGLPARAGSLNRPVFGKATRPSGVDFADDGELR